MNHEIFASFSVEMVNGCTILDSGNGFLDELGCQSKIYLRMYPRDQLSCDKRKFKLLNDAVRIKMKEDMFIQGLLKDGQESFSKIYKLFFRRYMPKPH